MAISKAFETYRSHTEFVILSCVYPHSNQFLFHCILSEITTIHPVIQAGELRIVFFDIHLFPHPECSIHHEVLENESEVSLY